MERFIKGATERTFKDYDQWSKISPITIDEIPRHEIDTDIVLQLGEECFLNGKGVIFEDNKKYEVDATLTNKRLVLRGKPRLFNLDISKIVSVKLELPYIAIGYEDRVYVLDFLGTPFGQWLDYLRAIQKSLMY